MTTVTPSADITSAVIYEGPSMIDGAPIVVIATGLGKRSRNEKTGDLIQTWIIRSDVSPVEAIHSGADQSICGTCPHRGVIVDGRNKSRSCYVTVHNAPLSVFKAFKRGVYPRLSVESVRCVFQGRRVRLGAYGDPAAVPYDLWAAWLAYADANTGYTHQWRTCDPAFARFVMASCDTLDDYTEAKARGYRTFRVRTADEARQAREVICPASEEAGKRTTCAACIACGGTGSKARADIVIVAHGAKPVARSFEINRARSAA